MSKLVSHGGGDGSKLRPCRSLILDLTMMDVGRPI